MSRLTKRILLTALLGLFLTAPGVVRSQGFDAKTLMRAQQRGQTGGEVDVLVADLQLPGWREVGLHQVRAGLQLPVPVAFLARQVEAVHVGTCQGGQGGEHRDPVGRRHVGDDRDPGASGGIQGTLVKHGIDAEMHSL